MSTVSQPRAGAALRDLTRSPVVRLFAGNVVSACGMWFHNLAQALYVFRMTDSAFQVGLANFANFIAIPILAPLAGAVADRSDRIRVLVAAQWCGVGLAVVYASLVGLDLAPMPVVLVLALGVGATMAFTQPALLALVPSLVTADRLRPTMAWFSASFTISRAAGPVLAAVVVASGGPAMAFAFNACSYLALIVALHVIRASPPAVVEHEEADAERPSIGRLIRTPPVALMLFAAPAGAMLAEPVNTLLPSYAVDVLHRPDTFVGVLLSAFGLGTAVGAVALARLLTSTATLMFWCTIASVVGMSTVAASPGLVVTTLGLFSAGVGYSIVATLAVVVLQSAVVNRDRGRIMATWNVAAIGSRPLGSLLAGAGEVVIGVRAATALLAAPAAASALLLRRRQSQLIPRNDQR